MPGKGRPLNSYDNDSNKLKETEMIKTAKMTVMVLAVAILTGATLAAEENWKNDTMLVSLRDENTAVCRAAEPDKVLFQNKDAQLAIEEAIA